MKIKKFILFFLILLLFGCEGGVVSQNIGRPLVTISFVNASPFSLGLAGTGTTVQGTVTLQITGGVAATNMTASTNAPFGLLGGSYPGTGGTCTASEQNSTCTIVVTYSPVAVGTDSGNLVISYNINGISQTTSIILTGYTQSVLTISDGATYDYGIHAVGSFTNKIFTVTRSAGGASASNIGSPALPVPFSFTGGSFPGTGGSCSSTLPSTVSSCTISVTFNPQSIAVFNATITLFYFDGISNTSTTRPITAQGVPPAVLTLSDAGTYNFGTYAVGSLTDKVYTVTYASGGVPATSMIATGLSGNFVFKGGAYPGTGGTCGSTLAAGSCTIIVQFTPLSVATFTATMNFNYFDGAFPQSITRNMTGIGVPPAVLSVSPTNFDYGLVRTGNFLDKAFTVTHISGGVPATGLNVPAVAAPYTYAGGSFPGIGGTCPANQTVAIGSSCTVVIRYAPATTGTYGANLSFSYYDGAFNQSVVVPVTGTTQAGLIISNAPTYDFGSQVVGVSTNATLTVTYSGGVPATGMSSTALSAPFSYATTGTYPGSGGTCGATLSSGSCTIVVNYTPTATVTSNATITINYNDGFSAQSATRNITGTGVPPTVLSVSDAGTYNFGNVVTSLSLTKAYTVTYVSGALAATSLSVSGLTAPYSLAGGYPGSGGTCSATLASGSCTFIVTYAPTVAGVTTNPFTFNYFDGAVIQNVGRTVTGTGLAPAVLTVSDVSTYNFGSVHTSTSVDKTYTVTYSSGNATATSISLTGLAAPFNFKGGSYPGTGGTCSTTLSSGSCTIVITFNPTVVGVYNNTFTFSYFDGAATQNLSRSMTGLTEGLITISDAPIHNWGSWAAGAVVPNSLTLTYSGGLPATGMNPTPLVAPYGFWLGNYPGNQGTCGTTLSSGSCIVSITFSPPSTGTFNGTFQINYFDGFNNVSASRSLTGTGVAPANLVFVPATTTNFGTHAVSEPTDATLTITNAGAVNATYMTGSGLSGPYTFKGGSYPGTGGTCAAILAPSANCTIVVTYTPTAVATQNATIDINYLNGAVFTDSFQNLTGTGAALAYLTISDGLTYSFGNKAVGSTTTHVFTLTNTGANTATSLAGNGLSSPYSFYGGAYSGIGGSCGVTLAQGASCTFVVSYKPLSAGAANGTIQIVYNNSSGTQTSTRAVTGTASFTAFNISALAAYIEESRLNNQSHKKILVDLNEDKAPEFFFKDSIYDGKSQRPLFSILGIESYYPENSAVSISDDFDEDTVDDILVGNSKDKVYHFSSSTGRQFKFWPAPLHVENFGTEVFDYYDLDGDGRREFLVLDKNEDVFIFGADPTHPMYVVPHWEIWRKQE